MVRHIIYGDSNCGKTTTCRKLRGILSNLYPDSENYYNVGENDFKSILSFGNRRIGIYSAGDEKAYLKDALDFGKENECNILIATAATGIHYNDPLSGLVENKDYFWHTLKAGNSRVEVNLLENEVLKELLNIILEYIR